MLMELSKMPTSLKNNEKAAIIIPSVFLRVKDKILNNCRTFEECDKEYFYNSATFSLHTFI